MRCPVREAGTGKTAAREGSDEVSEEGQQGNVLMRCPVSDMSYQLYIDPYKVII